jgi:MATE family multidrug resistance protein
MLKEARRKRVLGPWSEEARATLLLAYPLILTNLTQAGIQATDVVLLGWAGPETLAAGALGTNLYNAFLIFAMGLVTAAAPMIARELGERRHSVRDVRRTVRQAMWAAVAVGIPILVALWNAEAILLAFGQDPKLAASAGRFLRFLEWGSFRRSGISCCAPSLQRSNSRSGR